MRVSVLRSFALCAALLTLGLLPATAAATSSQTEIDAAVTNAVEYARGQQIAASGGFSGFGANLIATSLAAAGVDAGEVRVGAGDPSLQDFLLDEYGAPEWGDDPPTGLLTDYEQATLITHAAGLDPARLSAVSNQPAQVAAFWNPAIGSFGDPSANGTAFAILAMKTTPLPRWALAPAVSFLRRNQHDDGGWTYAAALTPAARANPSEEDMTGAAIAALCEAGVPAYDPAVSSALDFLRSRLIDASGGIEYIFSFPTPGLPNADTNAWVVSGLNACGIDPQSPTWTTSSGKTPVDYLLSLQVPSGPGAGGFGYEDAGAANFYATQDTLRALAGAAFTAAPQSVRTPPAVAAGTPTPHVLAIELAPGNVRICKVTAPVGASLTQLLAAAESGSQPSGCVTSLSVSGGTVKAVNGVAPESEDEAWLLRLDRRPEAIAGEQPVGFGELVALRLGHDSGTSQGPAGAPGPAGSAGVPGLGLRGRQGRRGPKGKAGRNATLACKVRKGRNGKRVRCAVKHHRQGRR